MIENTNKLNLGYGLFRFMFHKYVVLMIFGLINLITANNIIPPYENYCKMLEKDITGVQHGFLSGNKMYYVGGQTDAFWEGIPEEETIGLTHPFFRDMRSRGFGIIKDEYGSGHDKWGWEFYRMSKAAYGTIIANNKEYKNPKPNKIIWRPDRQLTYYNLDDIEITETKFITKNDIVCAIIKSNKPIKIRFEGSGYYNGNNIATFDGDEEGIPWQQNSRSKISFDRRNNSIRIDESSDMMVKPNWGERAKLGKMMYEGMSILISVSKPINNTHRLQFTDKNIPTFDFTVSCDTSGIILFYGIGDSYDELVKKVNSAKKDVYSELEEKTRSINELLSFQIPYFRCSDKTVVDTYYYLWAIYFMYMLDVGEGFLEYPHTQTAVNNFMGLHLWDSSVYTRMGSWVVDKWDYGFGNMLNWTKMLPFSKKGGWLPDNFGINWYSPVWFTPIYMVPGAWMMYQHSGDEVYLTKVYKFLHELFKDEMRADPAFVLMASSYLEKMAVELKEYDDIHLWKNKYEDALGDFYNSWEIQEDDYYGNYNYLGKDIWHLAALMADEFPDQWASDLTDTWIMDTENGFLGPVALDVRAKKSVQNGIFEVSTISTWQVIEGLFENNIDKEAVFITLSHIYGMNRDYGFPVAPEVWTPDYKPWGSMFYNWDGAIVLPIIKRLAGFEFSVPGRSITIKDHMPPEWTYIDLIVPIIDNNETRWVQLKIERDDRNKLENEEIKKKYTVSNAGDWEVNVTPWNEGRDILTVESPSFYSTTKNRLSESIYSFIGPNNHMLNIKLGSDDDPLQPRILVTPEVRQFIDEQIINITNLMAVGDILYQTPGSKKFKPYNGPVKISKSGTLLVKVVHNNHEDIIYKYEFKKEVPIKAVQLKNKIPGINYKYYEGEWENLPDFEREDLIEEGNCDAITVDIIEKEENFGLNFEGYIEIPNTGIYTFFLRSNDGSKLMIGDKILSTIDGVAGLDPIFAAPSRIALEKGFHPIRVDYFQKKTRKTLFIEITGPNMNQQNVTAGMLFRDNK